MPATSDTYLEAVPDNPTIGNSSNVKILNPKTLDEQREGPDSPAYVSGFNAAQRPWWAMVDALWGGTDAMRAAGERYLPRYEHEDAQMWKRRIAMTVLLNFFKKTIQAYVGKPFGKPLTIPDEMPDELDELFEDVDDHGTNLDMLAREGFRIALQKGTIHAVIDYPTASEGETAADEIDRQPIVTLVQPECLLGARVDANGELEQVRIWEESVEPDGAYGEKRVCRVRVLERGSFRIFIRDDKEWRLEREGKTSLTEIPFVTFMTDQIGHMISRPPLLDLAFKNIEHWQSSSDQRNILTVARFPILFGSGINPQENLTIGPNHYYGFRDKDAKLGFVEHGGQAVSSGRQDMEDLKAEMATMGLSLLMPTQSGAPTATAKALDGAEAVTELQALSMGYEQFINEIAYWCAAWMDLEGKDELPRITISQDYAKLLNDATGIGMLMTARTGRDISRKALIDELKRRNILSQEFDPEADAELMAEEASQNGDGLPARVPGKPGLIGVAKQEPVTGEPVKP